VGSVRTPVATVDFSPFIRRAKDSGAQSVFIFTPAGNQPAAIMKTLLEQGVSPDKVKILGSGELTDDSALKGANDAALGVLTAYHYDHSHKSALN
jgi:branched-chain amino acid transport system substrate-binding protein